MRFVFANGLLHIFRIETACYKKPEVNWVLKVLFKEEEIARWVESLRKGLSIGYVDFLHLEIVAKTSRNIAVELDNFKFERIADGALGHDDAAHGRLGVIGRFDGPAVGLRGETLLAGKLDDIASRGDLAGKAPLAGRDLHADLFPILDVFKTREAVVAPGVG